MSETKKKACGDMHMGGYTGFLDSCPHCLKANKMPTHNALAIDLAFVTEKLNVLVSVVERHLEAIKVLGLEAPGLDGGTMTPYRELFYAVADAKNRRPMLVEVCPVCEGTHWIYVVKPGEDLFKGNAKSCPRCVPCKCYEIYGMVANNEVVHEAGCPVVDK